MAVNHVCNDIETEIQDNMLANLPSFCRNFYSVRSPEDDSLVVAVVVTISGVCRKDMAASRRRRMINDDGRISLQRFPSET